MDEQGTLIERSEDASGSAVQDSPDQWESLPEPSRRTREVSLVVAFEEVEDRDLMVRAMGMRAKRGNGVWSARWPPDDENAPALF